MTESIKPGDCVRIPDGRVGRVRDEEGKQYRVRVRRKTSNSHQFLTFDRDDLVPIACPEGWMSPAGYNRYLAETLSKMRDRQARRPGDD